MSAFLKIKKLIENPKHWCKHWTARDKYGKATTVDSGYSFCLLGAAFKVLGYKESKVFWNIVIEHTGVNPMEFNDNSYHEEVIELLTELEGLYK